MGKKICLITGATSGIGKATAIMLAERGVNIVIVGRTPEKTQIAVDTIKPYAKRAWVQGLNADLSIQDEVRQLAESFLASYDRLDILINNAGVYKAKYTTTLDGIETTLAVNYLSPYLLTRLLIPMLEKTPRSRIVILTSSLHKNVTIHFNDISLKESFSGIRAYRQSELARIMFTYKLASMLEAAHKKITINAIHPGYARTQLGRESTLYSFLFHNLPFVNSPFKAGQAIVYAATAKEMSHTHGQYIVRFSEEDAANTASVVEDIDRLWDISATMTKLPLTTL